MKKLLIITITLCMVFVLTACSTKDKNNSGNSYDDCGYIYNIAINGELLSNDDFK